MVEHQSNTAFSQGSFTSNTAVVFGSSFSSPRSTTTIVIPGQDYETKGSGTSPKRARGPTKTFEINPTFKLVFLTFVGLTVLSFLIAIIFLLALPTMTDSQKAIFEGASFGWKSGLGVIFGLIGGKVY